MTTSTDSLEQAHALLCAATTADRDVRPMYAASARAILLGLERRVATALMSVRAIEAEIAREAGTTA